MRFPLAFAGTPCLLALAAPAPAQIGTDDVAAAFGVADYAEVGLDLPAEVPERFSLRIALEGQVHTLALERRDVRSERFQVRVQGQDGAIFAVPAPAPTTYRGSLVAEPGSRVALTLVPTGARALVLRADGRALWLQPLRDLEPAAPAEAHVLVEQSDLVLPAGFCGALAEAAPAPRTEGALGPGSCFRVAEVAFDCDHEYYLANGSSVAATVASIDAVMNAVDLVYAQQVMIGLELSDVLVRSSEPDPYTTSDPGGLLDQFVSEWRANQGHVVRDMAHLATGREMDGAIIGLAYVGVVCSQDWGYGETQFNLGFAGHVSVVAHEIGHNWNAPHCLDADFCGIMCGGCRLEFGPITTDVILAHRDSRGCLVATAGYADPVAPHVRDEELFVPGAVTVDVLANDFDGNCDPLAIDAFDAASAQGGSVVLSPGTGGGGRDELAYTPAPGFQGTDTFGYTVGDGAGEQGQGSVTLHVFDAEPDLALHYRFDETAGSTLIADSSASGLSGTYVGNPRLERPGAAPSSGTSVEFRSSLDRGTLADGSPLSGLRRAVSVALWVNPDDVAGARRLFGNGGSWHFAIRDGDLVFATASKEYVRPAGVPTGVWSHVAVVFDTSSDATLYLDGVELGRVGGTQPAGPASDMWHLAAAGFGASLFDGRMDDLQVYDAALGADDVRFLYDHPGVVLGDECADPLSYCSTSPNSVGPGATMAWTGTARVSFNDLGLVALGLPPGQFGIFFYGPNAVDLPFGEGHLCIGGGVYRLPVVLSDLLGIAIWELDVTAPPHESGRIEAGATWRFQHWYRDPAGGGAGFNLSDGLEVTFCP